MLVVIRIMDTSLNNNTHLFKMPMHLPLSTFNLPNKLNTYTHQLISFTRIKSSLTSLNRLIRAAKDAMEGNWKDLHPHNQSIQGETMMNICMQISIKSHNRLSVKLKIKRRQQFSKIKLVLVMQNHQRT